MHLWQAIILGGFYWFSFLGVFDHSLNLLFYQPLTSALLVGLVIGDIPTAMIVGATIQPMFLGQTQAGWVITNDNAAAGIITASVVIASGMDIKSAMAVAVAVGIVMSQLTNIRMTVGSFWNALTDKFISKRQYDKLWLSTVIYPSLFKVILYWLPMTLVLYFGASNIGFFVNGLPGWLQNGLNALASLMPIVGLCIVASSIGKKGYMPFFIAGFLFAAYSGVSGIGIAIVSVILAWFDFRCQNKGEHLSLNLRSTTVEDAALSRRDLNWASIRMLSFYSNGNSYERYQANGIVATMMPCLRKLYKGDDDGLQEAMVRTSELFNAEDMTSALPVGILLSMEEQKAKGAPIPGEIISDTKAALFPPMAAVGDTLNWATIVPTTLALMCPYALTGAWWPALVVVLVGAVLCNSQAFFLMHLGYNLGNKAIKDLVQSGLINKVMSFFTVMGMFVIGGMISSLVSVSCPLTIATGKFSFAVQKELFDVLMPNLLTFIATMIIFFTIKRKNMSVIKVIFGTMIVGIILGALGIIA